MRHVGSPLTSRFADGGLGTTIGQGDRETVSTNPSGRRRRQLRRLRRRQQWVQTRAESPVHRHALAEVRRLATTIGLSGDVRDAATALLSSVYEAGFFPGHSIEGVATAVVYATARIYGHPRRLTAVARVSQVDETEFRRTYLSMVRTCSLAVPPARPQAYLPALATDLGLRQETERQARMLLEDISDLTELVGSNPVGLAAMAVYAASCVTSERLTQSKIAEEAGVSAVTIRVGANRVEEVTGSPPSKLIRALDADGANQC